jgi:hypothetical protein
VTTIYVVCEAFWQEGMDGALYQEDAATPVRAFLSESDANAHALKRMEDFVRGEDLKWMYDYIREHGDLETALEEDPDMEAALDVWKASYLLNPTFVRPPPDSVETWIEGSISTPSNIHPDAYKHMAQVLTPYMYCVRTIELT